MEIQTAPKCSFSVDYLHIPSVEEARNFFGPITTGERAWRSHVYFNELLKSPRSRLGIGEHDRAEAYIFGNGAYPEEDKRAHLNHFPVSVKVMKIEELFIDRGEVVDLSAYAGEFPWNAEEVEIYLVLNVNRLILSAGSKILVKGNVFILNCLNLIGNDIGEDQATVELSASDSVQHSRTSRLIPLKTSDYHGRNGADGEPLKRESTPLGLRVIEGTDACKGQNGGTGHNGADGSAGPNGAMLFLSDIRFSEIEGFQEHSIKLKAGAAPGFPGGNGHDGGDGGSGGQGASGIVTPFGMVSGWPGGHGGRGGNGGSGGKGGNGGLACAVFVSVPPQKSFVFETETFASAGGRGGEAGKGGQGGAGGLNGHLYEDESSRSFAPDGDDGPKGIPGIDGKTRGAPCIHIYEQNNQTN